MNKWLLPLLILILTSFQIQSAQLNNKKNRKKVFYVNSYHKGYAWSDDITATILKKFHVKMKKNGKIDDSNSFVRFKMVYMDTKLHTSEIFKQTVALKVKKMIDEWKPDVIITSDDNAVKYLIKPYYKDANIPVVFCGINIDASIYGLPYKNTTGMVEVLLVDTGYKILKPYMKKNKICSLSSETFSDYKIIGMSRKYSNLRFDATFVNNYSDLKKEFIRTQNECGILFVTEPFSIKNFNRKDYKKFVYDHIKIPIFTAHGFVKEFALLTVGAVPSEQGEWAANAAIRILNGEKPQNIPIVKNKKAQIFLNMKLAKKLNIIFPMSILEEAYFVDETNTK